MAKVQLANVAVLDNPSPFLNPFQFEVTFECIEELKEGERARVSPGRPIRAEGELNFIHAVLKRTSLG